MKAVRSITRRLPMLLFAVTVACAPTRTAPVAAVAPVADGVRVVSLGDRTETSLDGMVARLARADVVFFGEQHDDPETHRAEEAVLRAIGGLNRPVVLSLEMFERDVQAQLDDYLAGRVSESEFLARSRPWPRYASDYRPLVEMAKQRGWRVVAANVPRLLASAVGRRGLSVLDTLAVRDRSWAATEIVCPPDDYRARFMEEMRSHSPGSGSAPQAGDTLPSAIAERFFLSQCLKDETMAESIVQARRLAGRNSIVVHFNGAFHSDFAQGTVDRVRRREPRWRLVVVTAVPVREPSAAPVAPMSGRGDYLIFTRARPNPRP